MAKFRLQSAGTEGEGGLTQPLVSLHRTWHTFGSEARCADKLPKFRGIIYVTKQALGATDSSDRPALTETDVSASMIEAGISRFAFLDEAGVGSAYLVEEVYRAMEAARRD